MKSLEYQNVLKKLIENKQLVEVNIQGAPVFVVAIILAANTEYLTLCIVSSSAMFAGVTMLRISEIDSISVESHYLSELVKQLDVDVIYQQALEKLQGISDYTFDGLADSLQGSESLVEITTYTEDNYSGKIVGYSDEVLAVDEYSTDTAKRLKRTYLNRETISRISIGVPWVETIARFLAEK